MPPCVIRALMLGVLFGPVASAQGPQVLEPGLHVRVAWQEGDARQRVTGTTIVVTTDSVLLRSERDAIVRIGARNVTRLDIRVRRARSTWRGAGAGALLGVLVAAPTVANTYDWCVPENRCIRWDDRGRSTEIMYGAIGGAILFGAVGAGIGALVRHDVWRDTTMALQPR